MTRKDMPSALPADIAEAKSDPVDFEDRLAWEAARRRVQKEKGPAWGYVNDLPRVVGTFVHQVKWVCPYCGEQKPQGYEPTQWSHCGEVGHAISEDEYNEKASK